MNTKKRLPGNRLSDWLDAMASGPDRLIAPVSEAGLLLFREVRGAEEACLQEGNTTWPLKEWLFPKTEPILHYSFAGDEVLLRDPELAEAPQIFFGVRPCDAAAVPVLDNVFFQDEPDPFYQRRRNATTIIGLSCARPRPECFCTSVGLSPTSTQGSDLLLTAVGGDYLAEAVTEKGEELLRRYGAFFEDAGELSKESVTREAESQFHRRASFDGAAERLRENFDSPLWEEVTRRCLGCGVCAFICPTCHCFDVVDEGDCRGGSRCKNWDSCAFSLFTLHASGHNPRDAQNARYRQRALHKFSYFVERFGANMCVGCGRCGRACPVNIDIYDIMQVASAPVRVS